MGKPVDSNDGVVTESADIQITSAAAFTSGDATGTYTYSKKGANRGELKYNSNFADPDYTENETGTVILTFTSAAGGGR